MRELMDAGSSAEASIAVLLEVQKADGGWGYYAESESRIEPTCWALSALSSAQDFKRSSAALTNARRFLLAHQDKQGFWTATPGMDIGNWVTSLACAVLSSDAEAESATQAGLSWLCSDYPLDSSPAVRFFRRLLSRTNTGEQDEASRGWGWTPRTSSWVEPTAFALLAMQQFPENRLPAAAATRRELAVALLYERMCPDGGWNSGNPRVYGVAGEALVLPTAWALLALRPFPEQESKSRSLAWLEAAISRIQSPASLAVASMCLQAYDRQLPAAQLDLRACGPQSLLADGTHVLAWTSLASNPNRKWPAPARGMR